MQRAVQVTVVALIGLMSMALPAFSEGACVLPPPQKVVSGVRWYADSANSIIDPEKRRQHMEALKGLHDFLGVVANAADHSLVASAQGDVACAQANLKNWAAARALLSQPTWSVATAEQTIAVLGLNISALKLKESGVPLPEDVSAWIVDATRIVINHFENGKDRGNMYTWAAAAAAINDILTGKSSNSKYYDRAWHETILKIRDDGYVDAELSRKGRALIYHNYLRGAVILLRRAREKLGRPTQPEELAALARLAKAVDDNVCDSSAIAALAGATQEPFSRWDTSIGTYFANAAGNPNWKRCAVAPSNFSGPTYGGRFDLTDKLLPPTN